MTAMLWGRAAGRCEFTGCNQQLWKSPVTQESVNIAQRAHIYSFSPRGPRGNKGVSRSRLNDIENLMLVCHACHRKIDQVSDGGRYSAERLHEMKRSHEDRIELVTGISPDRHSHLLLYGCNIGDHASPLTFHGAASAMFPDRFPASSHPIELSLANSPDTDHDLAFWDAEARHLRSHFNRRVRERIATREIDHLSVFALAPQPLLVLLGTLLGDIIPSDVFQRHREPPTWAWPASSAPLALRLRRPRDTDGPPALILGLSATITTDRIHRVLGTSAAIWSLSLVDPHNDVLKSRDHLRQFREAARPLLDRIKAIHGQNTTLHIFPAAPVSVAVELGRARMPKADMPWQLYDQINSRNGFVPALTIQ